MAKRKPEEAPKTRDADLQIVYRSLDGLIPFARNSRTHSEQQVAQIAASIREFGFTNPVLVDADGGLIAGHGRVLAARLLGLDAVPTIELGHLTPTQRKAYVIADNKLALNAGWDEASLRAEFDDLASEGFDLGLTGFALDEIAALTGDEGGGADGATAEKGDGSLAAKFMIPPFSVLNAREGWWQDRKRAWLALGIKSELGRGGALTMGAEQVTSPGLNFYRDQRPQAAPGGSARPAADYSKRQRGNGAGRAL